MMKGNTVYGSTNLHALRHTFAVHRLLKWYQEGADVNAKLPLLSTYMGHAHYSYTQKYLTVLPRFIDIAGKLFADKFEGSLRDLEWPSDP
jgi:integrase